MTRLPPQLLRLYVRYAPGTAYKVALVDGVLDERLRTEPRRFATRVSWGAILQGNTEDLIDRHIYQFGLWQPNLTRWISATLRPGDVFVDVGANIGYFSLLASRLVGPDGAVIAIEASPRTFELLADNVTRNSARNVRLVNLAASDVRGVAPLYEGPASNRGRTTTQQVGGPPTATVPSAPLEEILTAAELHGARVIKIDVEGGEIPVLRGLVSGLGEARTDLEVVVEIVPDLLARYSEGPNELVAILGAAGYRRVSKLTVDYRAWTYVAEQLSRGPEPWHGSFDPEADYIFGREAVAP